MEEETDTSDEDEDEEAEEEEEAEAEEDSERAFGSTEEQCTDSDRALARHVDVIVDTWHLGARGSGAQTRPARHRSLRARDARQAWTGRPP